LPPRLQPVTSSANHPTGQTTIIGGKPKTTLFEPENAQYISRHNPRF
jgi:hypothetical protein